MRNIHQSSSTVGAGAVAWVISPGATAKLTKLGTDAAVTKPIFWAR
jgi:hypothetical protein